MWMAWWFADPVKSYSTALLVCCLDGGCSRVCVTSQAVELSPCIHKTCEMYGHPSMVTDTLYHNPHVHVGSLVVLQILSDLPPQFVRYVAWMEDIRVYGLHPRPVRPFPCIHKRCEMYVNPSIATDPHIITHTSLGIAWWFTNLAKP